MKQQLHIVKIGGNVINDDQKLLAFLDNFARLNGHKILVHGGGKSATRLSKQMGLNSKMISGRRVTSTEELSVVTMVYAGLINKKICARLHKHNCDAIGLSGVDANCIQANKRPSEPIDYGWAGDVKTINDKAIKLFIENGMTPVFCAITHNGKGQLLNTNADTIAAELAISLSSLYKTTLVYCFEKKGVLRTIHDDESVIQEINTTSYSELKATGVITEGMLPKMENSFQALQKGVAQVIIGSEQLLPNLNGLYTNVKL